MAVLRFLARAAVRGFVLAAMVAAPLAAAQAPSAAPRAPGAADHPARRLPPRARPSPSTARSCSIGSSPSSMTKR